MEADVKGKLKLKFDLLPFLVYEKEISTSHSTVRADVYVETENDTKPKKIVELKAYSAENTMPSTIKEQIKVTLRRHAQLAGFMSRQ